MCSKSQQKSHGITIHAELLNMRYHFFLFLLLLSLSRHKLPEAKEKSIIVLFLEVFPLDLLLAVRHWGRQATTSLGWNDNLGVFIHFNYILGENIFPQNAKICWVHEISTLYLNYIKNNNKNNSFSQNCV